MDSIRDDYARIVIGYFLLIVLVPWTALGRVYYGCHWLGDVSAGALIGAMVPYCLQLVFSAEDVEGVLGRSDYHVF